MELPIIDDTQNFIRFCQKANLPITEMPEKGEKMNITYEAAMKELDPYLYERLTKQGKLKADVLDRHQRQAYWTTDVEELEAKGYTGVAANLRKQIEEGRRINEENKLREMMARNQARDEAIRNRPSGFHPTKNIDFNSPEARKARRQWGLSDDIGLGA